MTLGRVAETCGRRNIIREGTQATGKTSRKALTGLYAAVCRHGCVLAVTDIKTSEHYGLPLAMVIWLLLLGYNISHIFSDVGCILSPYLDARVWAWLHCMAHAITSCEMICKLLLLCSSPGGPSHSALLSNFSCH